MFDAKLEDHNASNTIPPRNVAHLIKKVEKTLKWRLEDAQPYYGFVLVRPNITEYRSLIPLATEEVLQEWKKSLRAEGLTDTEITEYGYGGEAHTYVKTKLD